MEQKHSEERQRQKEAVRSCEDRIQNDLSEEDPPQNKVHVVRSLQQNSSSGGSEIRSKKPDTAAEQQRKKMVVKNLKQGRESSKIKEQFSSSFHDKNFGTQIIRSEEVSVADSFINNPSFNGKSLNEEKSVNQEEESPKRFQQNNSDIQVLKQKRLQQINQPMALNILVAGAAAMGKSSFIDLFLNVKYERLPIIRDSTSEIKSIPANRDFKDFRLELTFIDTPGFKQSNFDWYLKLVTNYITNKFEEYNIKEQQTFKRSHLMKEQKRFKDQRVHCCLYFLKGPRVDQNDWIAIKQLENYVAVLPVIGKGDTYTTEQMKELKLNIKAEKKKRNVNWFDLEQYIRQKNNDKLNSIQHAAYGQVPPFVVAGCVERVLVANKKKEEMVFCRSYKWGACYPENPQHTDFLLLKNLLLYYLSIHFTQLTAINYKKYIKAQEEIKRLKKQQNQHKPFPWKGLVTTIGVVVVVGCGIRYLKTVDTK